MTRFFKTALSLKQLAYLAIGIGLSQIAFSASLNLSATSFDALPGWQQDNMVQALAAFKRSCQQILKRPATAPLDKSQITISAQSWYPSCQAALSLNPVNDENARNFFMRWFTPYLVSNATSSQGLFTGYYEPSYPGSLHKTNTYKIPLYAKPTGLTRQPSRSEINQGALANKQLEIAWLRNKIDRFFLQVQGSGKLRLDNGQTVQIGFAGKNGYPYTTIGRYLIEQGELSKQHVSMKSIRHWLATHPQQAQSVLEQNASFIYFRILKTDEPIGAGQVPLTATRSLAVDRRFIPLGAPLYLSTQIPTTAGKPRPFNQLMIAQDTGSAIRGAVRGDIFWGAGAEAERIAGHMQSKGRYWILLPKNSAFAYK